MKTLIISLNSKYIHSSLAAWYLKAACGPGCGEVAVSEHTINENTDSVLSAIYSERPDFAAFSCYIWNISHVYKLASSLKKLLPGTVIILGGPEVSYDAADILGSNEFIDLIIAGEGDIAFPEVIRLLNNEYNRTILYADYNGNDQSAENKGNATASEAFIVKAAGIDGLVFRKDGAVVARDPAVIEDLDSLPTPYTDEMLASLKNRIAYFEASRGCPFSCSYCLSSVTAGTRYFSLDRVFSDLGRLVGAGIRQIKFVDRTFNANPSRAKSIIRYILELNEKLSRGCGPVCNFHFEVGADLFDVETIELLAGAPKGLFQLEAGVQSTNVQTLAAICRRTDIGRLSANLQKIRANSNVHIHADLIAGLPYENYVSFGRSFNDVYRLKPHHLQLGFLKFLKGTRLRDRASEHDYLYRDYPPYEILSGRHMSGEELMRLKGICELVERYYNSGRFTYTLNYMISGFFASPFEFFERLHEYHKDKGYLDVSLSARDLYLVLYEFFQTISRPDDNSCLDDTLCQNDDSNHIDLFFRELLRLDFLASDNSGTLPDFLKDRCMPGSNNMKNASGNEASRYSADFRERCVSFLGNTQRINYMIPETVGMKPKEILKKVHFEQFLLWRDISQIILCGDSSPERDVSSNGDSSPEKDVSSKGDVSFERDASSEGDSSPKGNSSVAAASRYTTLIFNYFYRDKVTRRYQFFAIDI